MRSPTKAICPTVTPSMSASLRTAYALSTPLFEMSTLVEPPERTARWGTSFCTASASRFFFSLVGSRFLLGLHWSLLSECGERDLATAIFDARPPCARLPYAEFTGVTFQRFDDQPAVSLRSGCVRTPPANRRPRDSNGSSVHLMWASGAYVNGRLHRKAYR